MFDCRESKRKLNAVVDSEETKVDGSEKKIKIEAELVNIEPELVEKISLSETTEVEKDRFASKFMFPF